MAVLVTVLIAAVGLAEGAAIAAPPSPGPDPVATGTPPDPQLAQAVAMWVSHGGSASLKALSGDFAALEKAAGAQNMSGIATSCQHLGVDVKAAQAYAPIPDPQAQTAWAAALAQYAAGASDCATGASTLNASLLTKASTEITNGSNDLDTVTARLSQIAGN